MAGLQAQPHARRRGKEERVAHALQLRDAAGAAKALDALSADELLQRQWLPVNIFTLELAGRRDEAELARETGREELVRAVVRAWSEGSGQDAVLAYRLPNV